MTRDAPPVVPTRDLFARYRPLPGVPDELVDGAGAMRPAWADLIAHLSRLSAAEIAHDFARGDQHLADAGVFFRRYGDTTLTARDWPFSPVPVILPEAEWREIGAGLIQRADLLEAVVADLYGANRLIAEGHLPARLIAENPEWLRPMVGVTPRSGHFLHFLAFEIGRGPDGRWWVLSDRTDAPSGAGFAIENRVAATRVFPELYSASNVHRLAGFFRNFRAALDGLSAAGGARVGILTPGPLTDTYYEQAYIARYLGMALLEGEDLTVEEGQLRLRTVRGPAPIDVLWRRMDGVWADPLELREDSRIGTPGLMSAVRQGRVTMVNALGVGVLETQALMAFLPAIARSMTGQRLKLPNVATWWCGEAEELTHVRDNAHRMMIGPAMATRLPFETNAVHAIAGRMRGAPGSAVLKDWLTENATGLMGKELVTLSTTPVFEDGTLVPRPMTIRLFLARTSEGWTVMPGGFARIGASADTTAISMRNGGTVADVWVLSDRDVDRDTTLTAPALAFTRAGPGLLPARAADNLFWLGRYVERTEGVLRLTRAYNSRLWEAATEPLLAMIRGELASYGIDAAEPLPAGLRSTLASAVHSASQIRDRFSVDGWSALKDMEKSLARIARTARPGQDAAQVAGIMLRKLSGFSGLVHENMYRAEGWQFLTIGRSLERAAMMADLLGLAADPATPEGGLDLAIEVGDSTMTHRQRYAVVARRESVIDLLALDDRNPRSVRFHVNIICQHADGLAESNPAGHGSGFASAAAGVQTALARHTVKTLDTSALRRVHGALLGLSESLGATYLP